VKSIATFDGDAPEAFPPMSVTLTLEDEIDLSRGDMLVSPAHPPRVSRHFEAMVVWFNAEPAEREKLPAQAHVADGARESFQDSLPRQRQHAGARAGEQPADERHRLRRVRNRQPALSSIPTRKTASPAVSSSSTRFRTPRSAPE
jgi:hypothetical protein